METIAPPPHFELIQRRAIDDLKRSWEGTAPRVTIVDPVQDYRSDARLFLALLAYPPPEVVEVLSALRDRLHHAAPEQFEISSEALHMTIKNVRTIADPPRFTEGDCARVVEMARRVIPRHRSFLARGEGIVVSPTSVFVPHFTCSEFGTLVQDLDNELRAIGVPDDKRYVSNSVFFGNVTLLRFTRPPSEPLLRCVRALERVRIPSFCVQEVHLVSSNVAFSRGYVRNFGSFKLADRAS